MRQPPSVLRYLVILLALSFAARAYADDRVEARTHYQAGVKFYGSGDYHSAIREFSAAQQLVPADLNNYNLALCYDKLGDAEPATQYYRAFLDKQPNTDKRAEIEASISRLEGRRDQRRARKPRRHARSTRRARPRTPGRWPRRPRPTRRGERRARCSAQRHLRALLQDPRGPRDRALGRRWDPRRDRHQGLRSGRHQGRPWDRSLDRHRLPPTRRRRRRPPSLTRGPRSAARSVRRARQLR